MDNRGLIFIPDISGFTNFVNRMEIDHSRHIISELLEVIINNNELGLEISEIEGDAILFYKYGEAPALDEIYRQVEKMFCAFHSHLVLYDHRRLCHCKACMGAAELTLKVVTHYGEFTGYTVKNFNKLIGKDIILAHQLLKNDIPKHEYWLVTDNLTHVDSTGTLHQYKWEESAKETEQGKIPFWYYPLTHLRENVSPPPPLDLELKDKICILSQERDFEGDILSVLHAAVDFQNRKHWQPGVRDVEDVTDEVIPRLGTSHRCLLEKGHSIMYTSSYSYTPDKVEYGETDEKKSYSLYFTFLKKTENLTRMKIEVYMKPNAVKELLFKLFEKKKWEKTMEESMMRLELLIRGLKERQAPGFAQSSQKN